MTRPIASIIITVFDQPESLDMLLAALETQTYAEPFEVIVCDDGSSKDIKGALDLCARRTSLDLKYVWQRRNGYRAARAKNNGIRCAQGNYLIFLDADVLVGADFVGSHIAAHERPRWIVCNPRRWLCPHPPHSDLSAVRTTRRMISLYKKQGIESVRRQLSVITEDLGDRAQQRMYHASRQPWMAFLGFSFSVDRTEEVRFDEYFEGWGPEDRELGFRLVSRHGFGLTYRDDIEVFHLEACSTGRTPFEFLPTQHAQIVAMLRNLDHFFRLYPDDDLSVLCEIALHYDLDLSPKPSLTGQIPALLEERFSLIEQLIEITDASSPAMQRGSVGKSG
jgi:glycosyltransferase involved in cell wall biosynthesis